MHRNHMLERAPQCGHIAGREPGHDSGSTRSRDKEAIRMRRPVSSGRLPALTLLPVLLGLAGCGRYASSPFNGFPDFIGDTHNIYLNPNRPLGDSDNMRRVEGLPAVSEPLLPEPGNVWPGPLPPARTLGDIDRDSSSDLLKPGQELGMNPRGSSTPPGSNQPGLYSIQPSTPNTYPALPDHAQPRPPSAGTVITPSGPAVINRRGPVPTYTDPTGATGIVVPNGNGTSTLVAPDGSVQTVPTPR